VCCVCLCFRFKQWYPVAILDDLDTKLPMHAQLLGLDLAIWWDVNTNQWRCAGWHMYLATYVVGCLLALLVNCLSTRTRSVVLH
jgi:hypothetical protein